MKKMCMAAALLLLCAPWVVRGQTGGATFYVSAAGNDENDGLTEATAFKTLYAANEAVHFGTIKTITVIGTLNEASEGDDNGPFVFYVWNALDASTILITGVPGAPEGRRAVLSAAGTRKNGMNVRGDFRFEHIEISGSSDAGLVIGPDTTVTLGPGSVVRNNAGAGVVMSPSREEWAEDVILKPGVLILEGGIVMNNEK
jgi:hypothetical protein